MSVNDPQKTRLHEVTNGNVFHAALSLLSTTADFRSLCELIDGRA